MSQPPGHHRNIVVFVDITLDSRQLHRVLEFTVISYPHAACRTTAESRDQTIPMLFLNEPGDIVDSTLAIPAS